MQAVVSPPEPLLISRASAARLIDVSLRQLDGLLASGEIPRVRIGASVKVDPTDLRPFIAKKKEAK